MHKERTFHNFALNLLDPQASPAVLSASLLGLFDHVADRHYNTNISEYL